MNLGEGAGYLVLVSKKILESLNLDSRVILSGFCNANDAYHQTASSPDGRGSYLAMSGALEMSGLSTKDIDYINLHGTGTQNNDISEGNAISNLFKSSFPKMSSTKSFTGHTLGACGGIEAVFSVASILNQIVYPNLRLETPILSLPFSATRESIKKGKINHVLSN